MGGGSRQTYTDRHHHTRGIKRLAKTDTARVRPILAKRPMQGSSGASLDRRSFETLEGNNMAAESLVILAFGTGYGIVALIVIIVVVVVVVRIVL